MQTGPEGRARVELARSPSPTQHPPSTLPPRTPECCTNTACFTILPRKVCGDTAIFCEARKGVGVEEGVGMMITGEGVKGSPLLRRGNCIFSLAHLSDVLSYSTQTLSVGSQPLGYLLLSRLASIDINKEEYRKAQ